MKNTKKIGIFLAFAPEQSLKTQGIGRLLSFLVSEGSESRFVIAIPNWSKKNIRELFDDNQINHSQYELITTSKEPYILRIKKFIGKFHNRRKKIVKKTKLIFSKKKISDKIINFFIYGLTSSSLGLFSGSLILISLSIISLFFIPFLFTITLILTSIFFYCFVRKTLSSIPYQRLKIKLSSHSFFQNYIHYKKYFFWFNQPLKHFKNNQIAQRFYAILHKQELAKLIKLVNSRSDIHVWFIPTLFWPEINKIKAATVVAAPDIVLIDFPTLFANNYFYHTYKRISHTICIADHLICYSNYVKQQHLMEKFQVPEKKISVIRHGLTDLSKYLTKNPHDSMTENSKLIIKKYQRENFQHDEYLRDFDFTHTKFIFYSSQIRPHKNFLNLLKAYEILLRQRYLNIKLILTGSFFGNTDITDFIQSRRLGYDILSFHDVSSDMLAALNHLAICAVNPTLFEGGFPFTFSEAYSVETPSVMSKISAVEEIIDSPTLKNRMLFDPYDINDMVEKIAFGIEQPDALYKMQRPLYEELATRSWRKVAQEYLNVFDKLDIPSKALN